MIVGRVEALHVLLPVVFRVGSEALTLEFVVDTGFTGFLTLPEAAVALKQLPYLEDVAASLADDTEVPLPVYVGSILWDGEPREVRVIATGRRPLLGTALLEGWKLTAEFVDGGRVEARRL